MLKYCMLVALGLFLPSTTTWAEYVVYKTSKHPLTRKTSLGQPSTKEFNKAYDIIIKYKWPTSIYTFYSLPDVDLQQNEESVIRQELHKAFPEGNIDVAFIPNIIYESAFLAPTINTAPGIDLQKTGDPDIDNAQSVLMQIMNSKKWGRIIDIGVLEALKKEVQQGKNERAQYISILKFMYDLNRNPKVLQIAYRVNQAICTTLIKDFDYIRSFKNIDDTPTKPQTKVSNLKKIKRSLVGNSRPQWNLPIAISTYFKENENPKATWVSLANKTMPKEIVKKVAALEWQAQEQNQALIFRGAQHDSPFRVKNETYKKISDPVNRQRENIIRGKVPSITEQDVTPYSLSYGYSLYAGMATTSGGSAYHYAIYNQLGYALKIDKDEFFDRNKESPRNMFWIPPFGTIISFYGVDDLFHPRTTVGLTEEMKSVHFRPEEYIYEQGNRLTSGNLSVDQFFTFSPIVWAVGVDRKTSWIAKVDSLVDYISKHAVVFYDPNGKIKTSDDLLINLSHTDLLYLKEHQKKFTNVLEQIRNNPRALKDSPTAKALPRTARPLPTLP